MMIAFALSFPGCVAPSMTIYGRGTSHDLHGNSKAVAIKEAQIYGDLAGNTTVQGSVVTVSASGGYYNSTVTRENYRGMAAVGRAVVQPVVYGLISGGLLHTAGSTATHISP